MSARAAVDRACQKLGVADLVAHKSDREVWALWNTYMGRHPSLLHFRIHVAQVLPTLQIDKVLTHPEQCALWATLQAWDRRFG